jgi:hypothetical protein
MTNRLIDKAHSYSTVTGIDFDDTFTGSNWPTTYGSSSFSSAGQSILNANGGLTSNVNDGPFPGQKSWRFENGKGLAKTARLRWSSFGNQTTYGANYIRPQNYSYSIWLRINSMDANPFYNRAFSEYLNVTGGSGASGSDDWYTGWYFGYVKNNNSGDANYGKPILNLYTGGNDQYISSDDKGQFIDYGKWYLVSIIKTKINSTTVEVKLLVNGVVKSTFTHGFEDPATSIIDMGNSNANVWVDHSLAGAIYGSNAVFTESVIREIYLYGAPIQVPVRYYNGAAWVDSSNQQIWNGSKWIPMYANLWTGTEWVPI